MELDLYGLIDSLNETDFKMSNILFYQFIKNNNRNLKIETKNSIHYIEERLHSDRGRFTWLANDSINSEKYYINKNNLFPRYYFLPANLLLELLSWLGVHDEKIISIETYPLVEVENNKNEYHKIDLDDFYNKFNSYFPLLSKLVNLKGNPSNEL